MNINFSNINWGEFISKDFWFGIDRASLHTSDKMFLFIGVAMIVVGIVAFIYARFAKNQFLARAARWFGKIFLTTGLFEGIWFALRSQYVYVLGTRFVATLLLVWALIWLYFPVKYLLRNYKLDMERAERQASRDKYLAR
jgi:uncharacterized membrane protein